MDATAFWTAVGAVAAVATFVATIVLIVISRQSTRQTEEPPARVPQSQRTTSVPANRSQPNYPTAPPIRSVPAPRPRGEPRSATNNAGQSWGIISVVGVLVLVTVVVVAIFGHFISGPATTTPTVTSSNFDDPLTSNAHGWTESASCFFRPDGLHVVALANSGQTCKANPNLEATDSEISVQAVAISGDGSVSIFFRKSLVFWANFGDARFPYWTLAYISGTELTTLAGGPSGSGPSPVNSALNTSNTLEVRARGTHIDLYINDTEVLGNYDMTFSASPPLAGEVYLGANSCYSCGKSEVVFSNLSIHPIT